MPYTLLAKWGGGILGGLAIAWIVYAGVIRPVTKPNPSTSQKADSITNYTYNTTARSYFGCATVGTYKKYPINKEVSGNGLREEKR